MSESKQKRSSNTGCIGDIAEVNPKTKVEVLENEYVSFVSMQDTDENGGITRKQARHFAKVKKGYTRFAEDDVLVAKITPCFENGKGGYAQGLLHGVGFGSTEFHVIRALPTKADSKYLYHLTRSSEFRRLGEASMTGSAGQKRVPAEFIREYPIFIPPLPEQKKIAEILSGIDKVINKTQSKLSKMKELSDSLLYRIEYTRGSGPDQGEASIDSITTKIGSGITPTGGSNTYTREGIIFLRSQNVLKMHLSLADAVNIPEHIHNKMQGTKVYSGDVLLNITGASIGRSAVVPKTIGQANVNQHVCILRTSERCDATFLSGWLNSQSGQIAINSSQVGGTRQGLNFEQIRQMSVPLPPIHVQKEISVAISASYKHIQNIEKKLAWLNSLKSAISSDLLSGRKRVTIQP